MKFNQIFGQKKYRNLFLGIMTLVFLGSFTVFNIISDLSNDISTSDIKKDNQITPIGNDVISTRTEPIKVVIDSVSINVLVSRPQSKDVSVLDNALLKGAVYYPGSGVIESGNMFIFAHSTGLSVVRNQAFKAFSNLKNVKSGDKILITGDDGVTYRYIADSISLVDENEALVQFDTSTRMLTLSTCNTFGKKQERHVVKAHFDGIEG